MKRLRLPEKSLYKVVESFDLKIRSNKILCPFHADGDPSLLINDNNTFKCFGCQKKGHTLTFVKEFMKVDDTVALNYIEGVLGITIDDKGDAEKEEFVFKNNLVDKGILYQTIKCPDGINRFCYLKKDQFYKKDTLEVCDEVLINGIIHRPSFGQEVEKKMVLLPTKPIPIGDIKELLKKIQKFIHKYSDMSEDFERIASYYVLMSWVYDRLEQLNYLSFIGDTGTGKTRCKMTVGVLCYTPILVNGGTSSAAVYRLLDKWGGTLLMDEADMKDSDQTNDMIKLLNCGNEVNQPVAKCDKNDPNKIDFFNPYSPKIISRRFEFDDKALESRCLTHRTQETRRKDILFTVPSIFWKEAEEIRNELLVFRLVYYFDITNPDEDIFGNDFPIEPRLKQVNTSLAVVLKLFPELFDEFKQFLLKKQYELIRTRSESKEGLLVNAYLQLVEEGRTELTAKDLADRMNELAEHAEGDRYAFSSRGIGKTLKVLSFNSKVRKINNKAARIVEINAEILKILKDRYFVTVDVTELFRNQISSSKGYVVTSVTLPIEESKQNNNNEIGTMSQGVLGQKMAENGENNNSLLIPIGNVTNVTDVTFGSKNKAVLVKELPIIIQQLKEINKQWALPVRFQDIQDYLKIQPEITELILQNVLDDLKRDGVIFNPAPDHFEVLT